MARNELNEEKKNKIVVVVVVEKTYENQMIDEH